MNKPIRFVLWALRKAGPLAMAFSAVFTVLLASSDVPYMAAIAAVPGVVVGATLLYTGLPAFCRDVWEQFEEHDKRQ